MNKQFFEWIDQHLKKNPYILISPCIRDYENHLAKLTKEYAIKTDVAEKNTFQTAKTIDKVENTTGTVSSETVQAAKGLLSGVFETAPLSNTKPTTANVSFSSNNQSVPFTFGQEKKSASSENNDFSSGSSIPGVFSFGKAATGSGNFTFGGSSTGAGSTFGSG